MNKGLFLACVLLILPMQAFSAQGLACAAYCDLPGESDNYPTTAPGQNPSPKNWRPGRPLSVQDISPTGLSQAFKSLKAECGKSPLIYVKKEAVQPNPNAKVITLMTFVNATQKTSCGEADSAPLQKIILESVKGTS